MEDELARLAANRARILNEIPSTLTMEQFKFYAWAVKGLVGFTLLGALWYARVESKINDLEKKDAGWEQIVVQRGAQLKAIEAYEVANDRLVAAQQSQIDRTTERVTKNENRIDLNSAKVEYMDAMRKFGVSNKEDYFNQHGYAAPANSKSKPDPEETQNPK